MTIVGKLWAILTSVHRRRLIVVVVLAVIAAAAEAGVVALIQPVIDGLTGADDTGSDAALVVFGVVLVSKNLLVIGLSWYRNRELFAIQADVSERLLDSYIRGTNPLVRDLDAGHRTSFAITEPLQLVLNGYLPIVTIIAEGLTLGAVVAVLIWQQPVETVVLIVLLAVGLSLFSLLTRRRITDSGRQRKDSDTVRVELLRSVLESRVEVRGLGVGPEVLDRYRGPNRISASMTAQKAFLTEASKNVLEILVLLALAPLALVLAYSDGDQLLAMLAMFGVAGYRAMPALNRIMVSSQSLKFGVATADALHGILAHESSANGDGLEAPSPGSSGAVMGLELEFDGFRLRNGKPVLHGQKVQIRPGQICVVWGASGSGKSTVLETLVDGGDGITITLNGRRLERGLSQMPGRVGVTAQSPLILPGSIRDNLQLGLTGCTIDLEAFQPLLDTDRASVLHGSSLSGRLDKEIHRHSVSGGQAQRISLIRALAGERDVILLDEPTSALDQRSADALCERLLVTKRGRIMVIVSHDPSLRRIADIVLEVD